MAKKPGEKISEFVIVRGGEYPGSKHPDWRKSALVDVPVIVIWKWGGGGGIIRDVKQKGWKKSTLANA